MDTEAQNQPTLMIDVDTCQPQCGLVDVQNVDADVIAALRRSGHANHLLESVLRVKVVGAEVTGSEKLPDVFGRRQILENGVRFFPTFPSNRELSIVQPSIPGHSVVPNFQNC